VTGRDEFGNQYPGSQWAGAAKEVLATLLGRPSDAKVTAGWAKLKQFETQQRAVAHREGRTYPAAYNRTLAQYVEKNFDAPGLVKDFDFSSQPCTSA
jgi:hypothetical protein